MARSNLKWYQLVWTFSIDEDRALLILLNCFFQALSLFFLIKKVTKKIKKFPKAISCADRKTKSKTGPRLPRFLTPLSSFADGNFVLRYFLKLLYLFNLMRYTYYMPARGMIHGYIFVFTDPNGASPEQVRYIHLMRYKRILIASSLQTRTREGH